jgi:3-phenylpropionate/cinnamic acid dioxygenase small subunit
VGAGTVATLPAEDLLAIQDLVHRYSAGIDRKDWDLLAGVFTPDCEVVYAAADAGDDLVYTGNAAYVAAMETTHRDLDGSLHRVSNLRVLEADADSATVRCYVDAVLFRAEAPGGDFFQALGFYDDQVVRRDGEWRIARRAFTFVRSNGNPAVPAIIRS